MKTDILNKTLKDVSRTLPSLTLSLRRSAAAGGWPEELVSQISVNLTKGKITIDYPSEIKSDIDSWEYGTEMRRPTAVIRKFANRIDSKIRFILEKGKF